MSDYTRVVLEADARGRLSISALDEDGTGHGHRFTGPKFVDDMVTGRVTPKTITCEIDDRDADALIQYAAVHFRARDVAPPALDELLDRLRWWLAQVHITPAPSYADAWAAKVLYRRTELVAAARAFADAVEAMPVTTATPTTEGEGR